MRYIGNKTRLLDFIEKPLIKNHIKEGVFCDLFSGTTSVAKYFKKKNYKIISNDNMFYSYVFQKVYVENNKMEFKFDGLIDEINEPSLYNVITYLNNLKGIKGFIFKNFSKEGGYKKEIQRNYFSGINAKKIDVIREKIEIWKKQNKLTEIEFFILLCSIIEKIPYVSNISGTYGAFLKINDPRMFKPFLLEPPQLIINNHSNQVFNEDANALVKKINVDILYIDPPYNHRQYPANYHLWETIAVWDQIIKNNITGLREYGKQKSNFCSKIKCVQIFEDLIKNANCSHILFSYNSEGIMSFNTIKNILKSKGSVFFYKTNLPRFKSNSNKKSDRNIEEWLFHVIVSK